MRNKPGVTTFEGVDNFLVALLIANDVLPAGQAHGNCVIAFRNRAAQVLGLAEWLGEWISD